MSDRLKTHYDISTRLSMMSDKKLKALLPESDFVRGWGQTDVIEINAQKVFVKKIPVTELEMANAYSTKNFYRIPVWYNYGVGSVGLGVFRELAAHVKTTNWVREGTFSGFPLLHHHRILATKKAESDIPGLKKYVNYWNGSKTVQRYISDRGACNFQLLVFLEYQTPLTDWLAENPSKSNHMFRKALKCIDFLQDNDMIHFDAHQYNWLTNGTELFLSDFGLLLDHDFELSESELQFFKMHRYYDYAQLITAFGDVMMSNYFSTNNSQWDLVIEELEQKHSTKDIDVNMQISMAINLHERKLIQFPSQLVRFFGQYQPIIQITNDFFLALQTGKKTTDKYPARKLAKLLRQFAVIG